MFHDYLLMYSTSLPMVKGYASPGLHRYNMLEGTNFKISFLEKFNYTMNGISSYFITLKAQDEDSAEHETFQVRIEERKIHYLDLTVSIARIKDESSGISEKPFIPHFHREAEAEDDFFTGHSARVAASENIDEVGKDVIRKALVRRVIDDTGYITLVGKLWNGKNFKPPVKRHRLAAAPSPSC
ncbi:unnamed protein product [Cochlearia groenlandica]